MLGMSAEDVRDGQGFRLLKQIRADERLQELPVISKILWRPRDIMKGDPANRTLVYQYSPNQRSLT